MTGREFILSPAFTLAAGVGGTVALQLAYWWFLRWRARAARATGGSRKARLGAEAMACERLSRGFDRHLKLCELCRVDAERHTRELEGQINALAAAVDCLTRHE